MEIFPRRLSAAHLISILKEGKQLVAEEGPQGEIDSHNPPKMSKSLPQDFVDATH
jgi:hypothetical protein